MKKPRILIVEDEAIVAMDIEDRLAHMGYHPVGNAASGERAIELADRLKPDLLLMDVRLQGEMDGITAAEEIRTRFRLPVIFLTAYSEDPTLERAKMAEPYGYILKPFEDRELKSTIEMALYKHRAEEEIRCLTRLYDVLSQINQAIVRIQDREELLTTVCRMVVDRGGIDLAWIGWLDATGSCIVPAICFGEHSDEICKPPGEHTPQGEQDSLDARMLQSTPYICNRCDPSRCFYPPEKSPSLFGFQSCATFPLRFQGRAAGTLNLCVKVPGFFLDREIELLQEVAFDISFALDRIESERRRKGAEDRILRQNAILSGIGRIFREALGSRTEEELGRICLRVAEEATESHFSFLAELNSEGRLDVVAVNAPGWETGTVPGETGVPRISRSLSVQGIYGSVIKTGKCVMTNAPASHSESSGLPPEHPPLHSYLGAPLIRNNRIFGMISLANREGGYGPEEVETLEALSPAIVEALFRKRAEQALARSRADFEAIFNSISDAIVFTDRERRILMVNPAFTTLFGYAPTEVMGRSTEFLYPDRDSFLKRGKSHFHPDGEPNRSPFEAVYRNKNGKLFFTESLAVPVMDANGDSIGIVGIHRDIRERKMAEASLRESEERFRWAMDATSDGLWDWNIAEGTIYYSPGYFRMLGYSEENLPRGDSIWPGLVHPEDRSHAIDANERCIENRSSGVHVEFRMRAQDGSWKWILGRGKAVQRNAEGRALRMIGTHVDVTEHKQVEEELRRRLELQDQFAKIAASVPGLVCSLKLRKDGTACMPFTTPAVEDLFGISPEVMAESTSAWAANLHPDDAEKVWKTILEAAEGPGPWHDTYRYLHPEKGLRWIEGWSLPQVEPGGDITWHGFVMDITDRMLAEEERARLEEQLKQVQRIEAIGRLAGGVAHDFNNMLGVIVGHAELALEQTPPEDPRHLDIREIQKAAHRSADLTRQLLAFARKQTANPKVLDLNRAISGMTQMLRRLIGEDINLIWKPAEDLWPVKIDPSQIDQVLANLVVNARDAITGGGNITIETENVMLDQPFCASRADFSPGEYVVLAVSDDGCGMSKNVVDHIFEPFFTTKEIGKGTGLGLATVYGVIRQNQGDIHVYSEEGKGTTFRIYFRRWEDQSPAPGKKRPVPTPPGGRETVLVVEDEAAMLRLSRTILDRLGYTVLTAGAPGEALRLSDELAGRIDLLITDVVMPEMNGRELAERIKSKRRDIRCLFMSGYTANAIAHHGVIDEGVHYIQKPFSVQALALKVREVLRG